MPTYDYRCERCSEQFEYWQSFSDETLTHCPVEGGPAACVAPGEGTVRKIFSKVGISFKGEGFYKTDHGSRPPRSESSTESASPSGSSAASGSKDSKPNGSSSDSSTSKPATSSTASD